MADRIQVDFGGSLIQIKDGATGNRIRSSFISRGEGAPGFLDSPIACMIHEDETVGTALAQLRELSHGFQPPADARNTCRGIERSGGGFAPTHSPRKCGSVSGGANGG
jgi:hypothetical protein